MRNKEEYKKLLGLVVVAVFGMWAIRSLDAAVKRAACAATETPAYGLTRLLALWGVCSFLVMAWFAFVEYGRVRKRRD